MQDWDPKRYLNFATERTRPARELVNAIPATDAQQVTDLGCGPGNSTALLQQRWPDANITGIDNSQAMLTQARKVLPDCAFLNCDINLWQPAILQDVILANASLQWATNHDQLFPSLARQLAHGGYLAIQMPDNASEPSHRLMREAAQTLGYPDVARSPLACAEHYYALLTQAGCQVDIWRTVYYHPLLSVDAIIDWLQATGLRPWLSQLHNADTSRFLARYKMMLAEAYPEQPDGKVLLRFPRLFIVARRN